MSFKEMGVSEGGNRAGTRKEKMERDTIPKLARFMLKFFVTLQTINTITSGAIFYYKVDTTYE